MTEKGPKAFIDQIIKDFLHRSLKKMRLFMGERYPLYHCTLIAVGLKIFSICLKIDVL